MTTQAKKYAAECGYTATLWQMSDRLSELGADHAMVRQIEGRCDEECWANHGDGTVLIRWNAYGYQFDLLAYVGGDLVDERRYRTVRGAIDGAARALGLI